MALELYRSKRDFKITPEPPPKVSKRKAKNLTPEKQYGGGTVLLWDRGAWIPREDPIAGYKKGRLKFELDGEKLHGGWTLVKSHGGKFGEKAWLLIKERDEFAIPAEKSRIVDERPDSVLSGRTVDAVAEQRDRIWESAKSAQENVKKGAIRKRKVTPPQVAVAGAVKARLPALIAPQLAGIRSAFSRSTSMRKWPVSSIV